MPALRILLIEPYHGGSHAAFCETLAYGLDAEWTVLSLPARHFKWRMRSAAAYFAIERREVLEAGYDLLVASSMLPLAELQGLCPALAEVPSVLMFHENQLAYPPQEGREDPRDHHYGFTQMVSALAATRVVFNSHYNRASFLEAGEELLRRMPDAVPSSWMDRINRRSVVLPLPLDLSELEPADLVDDPPGSRNRGPVLLWNHRWEHDKNPEAFFAALFELADRGLVFRVIVAGQQFRDSPHVFAEARGRLGGRVVQFGTAHNREAYLALLRRAHIVVSTARQEFFGISVLEAVHHGALPLVPDRLSYQELFPDECRYDDDRQLADRLAGLIQSWQAGKVDLRKDRRDWTAPYRAAVVLPAYRRLFEECAGGQ